MSTTTRRGFRNFRKLVQRVHEDHDDVVRLSLEREYIGDSGAISLAAALKGNTHVTELLLRDNNIGDVGAIALGAALGENKCVTKVELGNNSIGNGGAGALGKALAINVTIKQLYLSRNRIGPEGAAAIAEGLKRDTTVRDLDLRNNNIGSEGAAALAESLKVNSSLRDLYLRNCDIGPEGGEALGNALRENETLTTLKLGYNRIGDLGGMAIGQALRTNSTLLFLDLHVNGIFEAGISEIVLAMQVSNHSVRDVFLSSVDVSRTQMAKNRISASVSHRIDEFCDINEQLGAAGAAACRKIEILSREALLGTEELLGSDGEDGLEQLGGLPLLSIKSKKKVVAFGEDSRHQYEGETSSEDLENQEALAGKLALSPLLYPDTLARITACCNLSVMYSVLRERPGIILGEELKRPDSVIAEN